MMNSGKTSVAVSALMELASEAGLIFCVFSHIALRLSSMRGNLKSYQKTRYNKDLFILPYQIKKDYSHDLKTLKLIKTRLMEAKRKRCGIIMKSTFPQIVQLKFILECFRLKGVSPDDRKGYLQCLKSLAEILILFEKDIVSFIDECDLILLLLTEVNVPFGDPKSIDPQRVELVAAIYLILIHPKIREKLKLHKDQQNEVQFSANSEEIFLFALEELFKYPSLCLSDDKAHLKEAFKRH